MYHRKHRSPTPARRIIPVAMVVALALVIAACSGGTTTTTAAATTTTAAATTTTTAATTTTEAMTTTTSATGVLQPLDDGFPDHQITLWEAFDPGHTDDLFNIVVADIGKKYSPVPLVTQSHPSGARLQYGLVEFLRGQPGAGEGYNPYAISYFGGTLRPYTVEALADAVPTDVEPVNTMERAPFVFIAPMDSPFNSLDDAAAYAKDHPGELQVVGSSTGSGLHSTELVWAAQEGIDFSFIPTDGAGESKTVLQGGGAQLGCVTYQPGLEDTFKILAVTGDKPISIWPDVPTTADLGLNIPAGSFRGYGVIPGIPESHLEWLNEFFQRVFNDPEFAQQTAGYELIYTGPQETADLRQQIVDNFIPVLEAAGLTITK